MLSQCPYFVRFIFILLFACDLALSAESTEQFILVLDPPSAAISAARIPGTDSLWLARAHQFVLNSAVEHAAHTQEPILKRLHDLQADGRVWDIRPFWVANAISFRSTPLIANELRSWPGVLNVQPDLPLEPIPILPRDSSRSQRSLDEDGVSNALTSIRASRAWQLGLTGSGVLVANFDTGVNATHPGLSSRWRGNSGYPANQCWFDLITPVTPTPGDVDGHGTQTMGIICGQVTADTVGVAWNAQFIAAAVAGGSSTISNALQAFQWIIDPDGNPATFDDVPRVLSNSWGFSGGISVCNDVLFQSMDLCEAAGIAIVWAAGNEGPNLGSIRNPANRANSPVSAFAVGGWDDLTNAVWVSSSRGPSPCSEDPILRIKPEVVAPSVNVRTTHGSSSFVQSTGTSFAAPLAAGTLALMIEANPMLAPDSLLELLMYTSVDAGSPGLDNTAGYGKIDALLACQAALTGLGWVRGAVQNTLGQAINAEILVVNHPHHSFTNTSGVFRQALPAYHPFQLQVVASGYVPQLLNVSTLPQDTLEITITLAPTAQGILTGNVIDCRGMPGPNATISIPGQQITPVVTDGNGRFLMTLNAGTYTVACTTSYCNGMLVPDVQIQTGAITDIEIVLTLNPAFLCSDEDPCGYFLCDSYDFGGPTSVYSSVSPTVGGKGIIHNLPDDGHVPLSLPFAVTYYGQTYQRIFLNSNGIISFVRSATAYNNQQLPYGTTPSLYPFWDDFSDPIGGHILSDYDPSHGTYTLEYYEVPHFIALPPPTDSVNFQVVFYDPAVYPSASGNTFIEFRYGRVDRNTSATVGIDAAANGCYVRYGFNGLWESHAVPVMGQLSIRVADSDFPAGIPSLHVEPTSLALWLGVGESIDTTFHIYNFGSSALAYSIGNNSTALSSVSGAPHPDNAVEWEEHPKGYIPPRIEQMTATLDDPIPDIHGYAWRTSRNDNSIIYQFDDISGIGTNVGLTRDDTTSYPRPLPWEFYLYGRRFEQYSVCSNGFISFWSQVRNYINDPLTQARDPYYTLAPLWMDLDPTTTGQVLEHYDVVNDRFIVQWNEIPPHGAQPSQNMTFQAILYPTGQIDFVYEHLRGSRSLYTTGIKGGRTGEYLQLSYNGTLVDSLMTIRFLRPDTSAASVRILAGAQGVVPSQGMQEVRLRFKNNSLAQGLTSFPLTIQTSAPDGGDVQFLAAVQGGVPFEPRTVISWDSSMLRLRWSSHPTGAYSVWSALPGDSVYSLLTAQTTDTTHSVSLPADPIRLYVVTLAGSPAPVVASDSRSYDLEKSVTH